MKFFIVFLCLISTFVISVWEDLQDYIIIVQYTNEPEEFSNSFSNWNIFDRQKLCQILRNAVIYVDINKWGEFIQWKTYEVGPNNNRTGQQSKFDGCNVYLFVEGKRVNAVRCDYGISEIFLTKCNKCGNYFVIRKISSNSEILSTLGFFKKSFQILDCPHEYGGLRHFERDDLEIFKNIFRRRAVVVDSTRTESGATVYLPTEGNLNEAISTYLVNNVERSVLNLPASRKQLLCASILLYLSRQNGIELGKIVPFVAPVDYKIEHFSFLFGIKIVSIHCNDRTGHFLNLSIVPHTSKRGLIFIVSQKGTGYLVEQFFIPELINNQN